MKVCTDLVADIPEPLVVEISRVCGVAGNDELWLEFHGCRLKSIIINNTRLQVNLILQTSKILGRSRNLSLLSIKSMSQVTTLRQVKSHKTISWLE